MSYSLSVLPCQICRPFECRSDAPGHEQPIKIEIAYAGKPSKGGSTAGGIFCHKDSAWNDAFLLPVVENSNKPLHSREKTLHIAVLAIQRVGTFLTENPHESATGPSAIREIHLGIQTASFIKWYEKGACRRCGILR